jgi:uncharacterized protein YxjI
MLSDRFMHSTYLIRKKILSLFGSKFHIYDPNGGLLFYSKMKPFRLREDIRLYTGEDMQDEVLSIKARTMFDFSTAYDVIDSKTIEKVGTIKRKGFKSVLRDEWIFMDAEDREIGFIREDSMLFAFLRRFLTNLITQEYHGFINGTRVSTFKQNFNPFVLKIRADFSEDVKGLFDKRLGIAAAVLLCGIEGRQK